MPHEYHAGLMLDLLTEDSPIDSEKERGTLSKLFTDQKKRRRQKLESYSFPPVYVAAYDRQEKLVRGSAGTIASTTVRAASRLIIGSGIHTALETGIQLHHTYGVPYLPGSSLKGLVRRYTLRTYGGYPECSAKPSAIAPPVYTLNLEPGDPRIEYLPGPKVDPKSRKDGKLTPEERYTVLDLLFGCESGAGGLTFLDGWLVPEGGSPFLTDVITPHHQEYQAGKRPEPRKEVPPPADWDEPVPVPYVTVRPGTKFLLAVEGEPDWRELGMRLLLEALEHEGLGGKTNAGYGRLVKCGEGDVAVASDQSAQSEQATSSDRRDDGKSEPAWMKKIPPGTEGRLGKLIDLVFSATPEKQVQLARELWLHKKSELKKWASGNEKKGKKVMKIEALANQ